ncbi:S26 family signal peptidase [Comamonas endophytica]|uniref:S26 family signal peptidase n=1 Tax=Comamonas endophytica TaxID=2949090 RepID=UPI00361DCDD0
MMQASQRRAIPSQRASWFHENGQILRHLGTILDRASGGFRRRRPRYRVADQCYGVGTHRPLDGQKGRHRQAGRRRLVEICPPAAPVVDWMRDRGYLAAGGCDMQVAPLLKPIQAIAGDVVRLQPGRPAVVNGRELQNTRALPFMRAYPAGEYQVGPGEVWVFSSYSDGSFDSRYFGPVPLSRVRGIATPLWVSGSTAALSSGGAQ